MLIDTHAFTPWSALAGGALIGAAAALLVLGSGRIAGISGILGGLLRRREGDLWWRIAFLAGLLLAPNLYGLFLQPPASRLDTDAALIVLAGLLVGIGTRYGAGCTSGHGVCGLARLSPRSLAATLSFMAAGFAATYVLRHLIGV
ncbi:YeeE/YedE family protein [Uliginosibacterium sediminicola]|uniref:YeeE/YedE family protein n=1 Tax=Uliginosibacterium sediminicola TaxID=2024550 RepID=A0ABU9Z1J1_9RHOO